nr:hypothetical protein [Tanacetum cinerariifolium]
CYLRNVVIQVAVLNILSDALSITINGVNTPRSDEDRLKLMELMVFLLQKGVCDAIGITADRLSSYCCQANFWNTASVKCSGDVTRLQALVDKKKIVISEAVIREILQLNDAEGASMEVLIHTILQSLSAKRNFWNEFSTTMASAVICLSKGQKFNFSKYIFDSLNQVGDLSTHTTCFISPALTQKVFVNMRRVRKGFSGIETPFFKGMLAVGQPAEEGLVAKQVQVDDDATAAEENVAENVSHAAIPSPPPHDIQSPSQEPSSPPQQKQKTDNAAQKLEIVKLKARVNKLEKGCLQPRKDVDDMDMDEGIELVKDTEEVVEVVTTAKLITKVVTAAASQVSAASTTIPAASATIPAAKPTIPAATPIVVVAYTRRRKGVIIRDQEEELPLKTLAETPKVKDKGKGILVETPKPMKKKDQIEMDAEYARKLQEEIDRDHDGFSKDIDWDTAMDHVNQKSSNPQYLKRYQGMKMRLQTESEARKNMMIYLKNTTGYKMDFFKGMTYAQICLIFQARFDENIRFLFKSREEIGAEDQEIIKSINGTPAQKAAKIRKLSEEA